MNHMISENDIKSENLPAPPPELLGQGSAELLGEGAPPPEFLGPGFTDEGEKSMGHRQCIFDRQ